MILYAKCPDCDKKFSHNVEVIDGGFLFYCGCCNKHSYRKSRHELQRKGDNKI